MLTKFQYLLHMEAYILLQFGGNKLHLLMIMDFFTVTKSLENIESTNEFIRLHLTLKNQECPATTGKIVILDANSSFCRCLLLASRIPIACNPKHCRSVRHCCKRHGKRRKQMFGRIVNLQCFFSVAKCQRF